MNLKWEQFRLGAKEENAIQNINALYQDKTLNLWIGTENGIIILDFKQKTIRILRSNQDDSFSLSYNNITTFYDVNNMFF